MQEWQNQSFLCFRGATGWQYFNKIPYYLKKKKNQLLLITFLLIFVLV